MDMRGLNHFIQDIRKATSNREEEEKRIEVELAKIRAKFRDSSKLSAYDRKKYVCKLMFIAMLGYKVDFGHMEGVQLLSGQSNSEKLIGYLSVTVFLDENHELLTLTTHTVYLDLISGREFNTALALTAIANAGGKDFAEAMAQGVKRLVVTRGISPNLRKKAILTMLRMYRKYREVVNLAEVLPAIVELITHSHMGLSGCAVSFVQGVLDSPDLGDLLASVPRQCIQVLETIIMRKATSVEYIYYSVPAPWLQAKVLRLMQSFPCPTNEPELLARITVILGKIINATERVLKDAQTHQRQRGTQNRCNAMNGVLLELVSLVIEWDFDPSLLTQCMNILASFVNDKKEANLRYLGLVLTTRLSFCASPEFRFDEIAASMQQQTVVALHDPDISIRKRALELLYVMCNRTNADLIIGELLAYLPHAENNFKDDLVLIIAVLAEKFCVEYSWYCEIILSLAQHAGDHVPKDIWYRLCHVVTDTPDVQKRITESVFVLMQMKNTHEVVIKIATFLLGEFGYQIAMNAGSGPLEQVNALSAKMSLVSDDTKAAMLTTFVKFYNLYASAPVREKVLKVLNFYAGHLNPELQQRATEYLALVRTVSDETLQAVLEPLPHFGMESTIMQLLQDRQKGTDRDLWAEKAQQRDKLQRDQAVAIRDTAAAAASATNESDEKKNTDSNNNNTTEKAVESEQTALQPPTQQQHLDPTEFLLGATPSTTAPAPTSSNKLGNVGGVATAKSSAATINAKSVLDDIFGDLSPAGVATQRAAAKTDQDHTKELFMSLMLKEPLSAVLPNSSGNSNNNSNLLYEGHGVKITAVQEYRGADGRVTLTLTNNGTAPLEAFTMRQSAVPPNLLLQNKPTDSVVPPGASIPLLFACRTTGGFADYPSLSLTWQGGPPGLLIRLPIGCLKFMAPYPIESAAKFSALWDNITAGNSSLCHTATAVQAERWYAASANGTNTIKGAAAVLDDPFGDIPTTGNDSNNLGAFGDYLGQYVRRCLGFTVAEETVAPAAWGSNSGGGAVKKLLCAAAFSVNANQGPQFQPVLVQLTPVAGTAGGAPSVNVLVKSPLGEVQLAVLTVLQETL